MLLCDYEMPGTTGLELVDWLVRIKEPLMVILGTPMPRPSELKGVETRPTRPNIVRVLEKPYEQQRLVRLVHQTAKLAQLMKTTRRRRL